MFAASRGRPPHAASEPGPPHECRPCLDAANIGSIRSTVPGTGPEGEVRPHDRPPTPRSAPESAAPPAPLQRPARGPWPDGNEQRDGRTPRIRPPPRPNLRTERKRETSDQTPHPGPAPAAHR